MPMPTPMPVPMPEFAIIYHPSARTLSPEESAQRTTRVRAWAIDHRDRGVLARAYLLDDAGVVIAPDRTQTAVEPARAIPAVSIIRARDLDAALEIAKGHPGLDYGVTLEVRPLKLLPGAPQPAAESAGTAVER